ncbi:hypothetical protein R3P38DRAFT_2797690 [Favolaschia claudopus]|uniref:Uncharacterized protein n=1 Tax=Favolaschia claudopus TaxID=2862362 RepID=A0AAW0A4A1_9AGAR
MTALLEGIMDADGGGALLERATDEELTTELERAPALDDATMLLELSAEKTAAILLELAAKEDARKTDELDPDRKTRYPTGTGPDGRVKVKDEDAELARIEDERIHGDATCGDGELTRIEENRVVLMERVEEVELLGRVEEERELLARQQTTKKPRCWNVANRKAETCAADGVTNGNGNKDRATRSMRVIFHCGEEGYWNEDIWIPKNVQVKQRRITTGSRYETEFRTRPPRRHGQHPGFPLLNRNYPSRFFRNLEIVRRYLGPKQQKRALIKHKHDLPYLREGEGYIYWTAQLPDEVMWIGAVQVERRLLVERVIHLELAARGFQRVKFVDPCACGHRHREYVYLGEGSLSDMENIMRQCLREVGEPDAQIVCVAKLYAPADEEPHMLGNDADIG